MCLKPMYLGKGSDGIGQFDQSDALHFPPAAPTVFSPQANRVAN